MAAAGPGFTDGGGTVAGSSHVRAAAEPDLESVHLSKQLRVAADAAQPPESFNALVELLLPGLQRGQASSWNARR